MDTSVGKLYGLQAIGRMKLVWNEFVEVARVLKLKFDVNLLEHLQQMERDPDCKVVDSLMELQQNTESHELQCMLNYLSHWNLEDPLESVAETIFSYRPSYKYSVKATGERFRSHETNPKKGLSRMLGERTFRTIKHIVSVFVIFLACNKYIFTKYIFV